MRTSTSSCRLSPHGQSSLTGDPAAVNHEEGVCLLQAQDDLVDFLSHPVTAALYLRKWCITFCRETCLDKAFHMINHLGTVHKKLVEDTEGRALRLSGSNVPPPGTLVDIRAHSDCLLRVVLHGLVLSGGTSSTKSMHGAGCFSC